MTNQKSVPGTSSPDPVPGDLTQLISTLVDGGYAIVEEQSVGDARALIARRADWLGPAVYMHTFVAVFRVAQLGIEEATTLSNAARDFAIRHKGGMPRGWQTGTITLPTFVGRRTSSVV